MGLGVQGWVLIDFYCFCSRDNSIQFSPYSTLCLRRKGDIELFKDFGSKQTYPLTGSQLHTTSLDMSPNSNDSSP